MGKIFTTKNTVAAIVAAVFIFAAYTGASWAVEKTLIGLERSGERYDEAR